jgi:universal stress protein A
MKQTRKSAHSPAHLSLRVKPASRSDRTSRHAPDLAMVPSCLRLKHILVPVDFSDPSLKALHYAEKFAEQFGSRLTLLHVIQPVAYPADFGYPTTLVGTMDDEVQQQISGRLASLAGSSTPRGEALVRVGQPYDEITAAAADLAVDLIVIATHGHTGLKHALLGSTAERVVRHAPCPVLTVREREHDFA